MKVRSVGVGCRIVCCFARVMRAAVAWKKKKINPEGEG